MRNNRQNDQIRNISFETDVTKYAEGSCLVGFGDTKVLCTASVEDSVPSWMRGTKKGWVHAEYAMLPRATSQRVKRESVGGRQSGRSLEIQRLIGRSLRAVIEPTVLGERQVLIDCDVLQADGGTRTASITGAWVALRLCMDGLLHKGVLAEDPLLDHVVAISSGLVDGVALLDLEYAEDSRADADANFIFTGAGNLVEVQASGEGKSFSHQEFLDMMALARSACDELVALQKEACVRASAAP
ncbi:MAG: ribonuclease PH [Hyphomicrobiales bacterium]|nr:ribonuclease PH [Hyphomicrobiales bacterium]